MWSMVDGGEDDRGQCADRKLTTLNKVDGTMGRYRRQEVVSSHESMIKVNRVGGASAARVQRVYSKQIIRSSHPVTCNALQFYQIELVALDQCSSCGEIAITLAFDRFVTLVRWSGAILLDVMCNTGGPVRISGVWS